VDEVIDDRCWHKEDIPMRSVDVRLSEVKQTLGRGVSMSASDPKRTLGGALAQCRSCCESP